MADDIVVVVVVVVVGSSIESILILSSCFGGLSSIALSSSSGKFRCFELRLMGDDDDDEGDDDAGLGRSKFTLAALLDAAYSSTGAS